MKPSSGERTFETLLASIGKDLPAPEREYKFFTTRKWRFDFAWIAERIAVEIEGGNFTRGRHTRPIGFEQDCEKYNSAVMAGWRVLRFTPRMLANDPEDCIETVRVMIGLPFTDAGDDERLPNEAYE